MRLTKEGLERSILHEDADIIVLHKPAGIAVESARVTEPDLMTLLRMRSLSEDGNSGEVFMVHRLDQPVEGVMVFAKNARAAKVLSAQLTDGRMKKIYRAKVEGNIPKESDTLTDYLAADPRTNLTTVVEKPEGGKKAGNPKNRPKKAVLHYRKISEHEVEVELETGRHHQIRVQLAHAGMPIAGDQKYGTKENRERGAEAFSSEKAETRAGHTKLCLTAVSLTFVHPGTGESVMYSI